MERLTLIIRREMEFYEPLSEQLFSKLTKKYEILILEAGLGECGDLISRQKFVDSLEGAKFVSVKSETEIVDLIKSFGSNIIYFYDFAEGFCSDTLLNWIYRSDRTYKIIESVHCLENTKKRFLPDKIIYPSTYAARIYSKIAAPYNVVPFSTAVKPRGFREQSIQNVGLSPKRWHLLCPGSFSPQNHQKELFELSKWLPDVDFHFWGALRQKDKDYWSELFGKVIPNCYYHKQNIELELLYSFCDALIQCSETDIDGYFVKKALCYGMKVVLYDSEFYKQEFPETPNLRYLPNGILDRTQSIRLLLEREKENDALLFSFSDTEKRNDDKVSFSYDFTNGPRVVFKGRAGIPCRAIFTNKTTGKIELDEYVSGDKTIESGKIYFQDWNIKVLQNEHVLLDYNLDLKDKKVLISIDSRALGDTVAWIGYVEEFRKLHQCKVVCLCQFQDLVAKGYPNIDFANQNDSIKDVFATYHVGCMPSDKEKMTPISWQSHKLQDIAKHQLGLQNLGEVRPNLYIDESQDSHSDLKKYICVATKSTMRAKEWQNSKGWLLLTRWLREQGYEVINLSLEGEKIDGVKNVSKDESFQSILSYLKHCELFIGLSSGLSWLAWAMEKRVVIISGFANPSPEFESAVYVKSPEGVCNGCYQRHKLDIFDYDWCPDGGDFDCTRKITFEMVKDKVAPLLQKSILDLL